uniref:Uncharacterized protein n=1 Tax=Spongospora subterranea TaxID=70186 RepID=A0A0H5QZ29_9EUKA|eukprot:CRZ07243.1 hypothetical protein [Spongospora subterranea]
MAEERRRLSTKSFHFRLNNCLESNGFKPVSTTTSRKWLTTELRFRRHNHTQGVYFDEHDRADVQEYLHAELIQDALMLTWKAGARIARVLYTGDSRATKFWNQLEEKRRPEEGIYERLQESLLILSTRERHH